jgi:hypothetical protein
LDDRKEHPDFGGWKIFTHGMDGGQSQDNVADGFETGEQDVFHQFSGGGGRLLTRGSRQPSGA